MATKNIAGEGRGGCGGGGGGVNFKIVLSHSIIRKYFRKGGGGGASVVEMDGKVSCLFVCLFVA